MGKKNLLASALIQSGALHLIHRVRLACKKEVPVLTYHRILAKQDLGTYPYDPEVIDATMEDFDQQMQFIMRLYTPISVQTLENHIYNGTALPPRPILITFDDGFDDNYHNAYPILKKYGIPATIFIATDYISSKQSFWFERLSHLIMTSKKNMLSIEEIQYKKPLQRNPAQRREIYNECVEILKYVGKTTCTIIVDKLEQTHAVSNQYNKMSYPLSWEQCAEMAKNNITIGSHGTSHTILTQLNDEELADELARSKSMIEKRTMQTVTCLSFPNGQQGDFDQRVITALKKQGYRLYFSYLHGNNPYHKLRNRPLNRIHPPHSSNLSTFRLFLALPELF